MTFYRTYRPQTVHEVDTESIRAFLGQVARRGWVHAYLFSGPKGTGKTSAARILAKIVNCTRVKGGPPPCQQCVSCKAIQTGSFLDLLEIDAASNRGIDEIRGLRERILLAPSTGKVKVYIIDEAHMLTREAFNALLKTLEEPPQHAVFILCTTDVDAVPATIISRCQHVSFRPATDKDIRRAIDRVLTGEKKKLDHGVTDALIARSDGSFRDAVKLLEQLFQIRPSPTAEDVDVLVHAVDWRERLSFIQTLLQKKCTPAMEIVASWNNADIDMGNVVSDCLSDLHFCFLLSYGVVHPTIRDGAPDRRQLYQTVIETVSRRDLIGLIRGFVQAAGELKICTIPSLPIELLVAEYCASGQPRGSPVGEKLAHGKQSTTHGQNVPSRESQPQKNTQGGGNGEKTLSSIATQWEAIAEKIQTENHALGTVVRNARPIGLSERILTIEVAYAFHRDRLEQPHLKRLVERVVGGYTGTSIQLQSVLRLEEVHRPEEEIARAAREIFGGEFVDQKGE